MIFIFLRIIYPKVFQSGQSLIEHSYKADSDLSPSGWDYAERLRDFVLDHRAKALRDRGFDPQERRLVVRPLPLKQTIFAKQPLPCGVDLDLNASACTPYCLAFSECHTILATSASAAST